MKRFSDFLIEAGPPLPPMGGSSGPGLSSPGALPPGGPPMGGGLPMGGPPMGGGGLGPPGLGAPMGGMGGPGGPPAQTQPIMKLKSLDVWETLESLLGMQQEK